jgi:class 3 adenylate cyclase/tetratricopeptide (TPR) repeat protein
MYDVVICVGCRASNDAGRRFCGRCGLALTVSCPACGFANVAEVKFCGGCGAALGSLLIPAPHRFGSPESYTPRHLAQKILTMKSALEGEHKQVTVLFADLANSSLLAQRIGPEGMYDLLNRFFQLALAAVHRYEGTINQFLGDGFMALFGAPLAHEHHARQAVLAALDLRRALAEPFGNLERMLGLALRTRIGLNTGLVVVGKIGDNLRMDYTAVGDTTNVAARLQALAEPGVILLAGSTHDLVRGFVASEPMGQVPLRGRSEPVSVHKLTGLGSPRSPRHKADHDLSPFVGRARELELLHAALALARAGSGQAVGILGEPGIGKSRLLTEFCRSLSAASVTYLEGHCVSWGRAVPYFPILEILRTNCGITDSDVPEEIDAKVRFALHEVGMEPDESAPYLLHLLGLKGDADRLEARSPETLRALTFETLRQLPLRGSRLRPIVFVIEDLQWIDKTSADFVSSMTASASGLPILFIGTYRPEYSPPWLDRSYATQLVLGPLPEPDGRQIVEAVLQRREIPPAVTLSILRSGEGNPLFLEELARAVRDQEGRPATLTTPDTLQAVVMSRVDRLPADSKRLLQMASVVGREFSCRLLAAVWAAPETLHGQVHELTRQEFLYERLGAEEPTYVFKHALTRDVVYGSLLQSRRSLYHAAVGAALEEMFQQRVDEIVEALAYHFGQSQEAGKAVDYAIRAAEKAQRRWANTEALVHFEAALARLDSMPDIEANRWRRVDAVVKQAEVKFALGLHTEHIAALERVAPLVEGADPARRAAWHYWTGFLHSLTGGRPEVAIGYCQEASAIADGAGLEEIRAFADSCLAQIYVFTGDLRQAVEVGERALAVFDNRRNVWWTCRTLWHLSPAANALGEWDRSLAYCRRALEHGLAVDDLRLKVSALVRLGSTHIQRGDAETGLRYCEEGLALDPTPYDAAALKGIRGYALVKTGHLEGGIAALDDVLAWYDRSRLRFTRSQFAVWLADGCLRQGDRWRARAVAEEVFAVSVDVGYRYLEGVARRLLGECAVLDDSEGAAAHLAEAQRILEVIGARNEFTKTLVARARLHAIQNEVDTARQLLERALAGFEQLGTLDEPTRVRQLLQALDPEPRGGGIAAAY